MTRRPVVSASVSSIEPPDPDDESRGDREAEPGARRRQRRRARTGGVPDALSSSLESRALVGDGEDVLVRVPESSSSLNGAAVGAGIERVVEQVVEYLVDGTGYGPGQDRVIRDLRLDRDAALVGDGRPHVGPLQRPGRADRRRSRGCVLVGTGELQQVGDQRGEAGALVDDGVELGGSSAETRVWRFSSRSRRAVSGVRSWWEASATNARCSSIRASRRTAMVSMAVSELPDLRWPEDGLLIGGEVAARSTSWPSR